MSSFLSLTGNGKGPPRAIVPFPVKLSAALLYSYYTTECYDVIIKFRFKSVPISTITPFLIGSPFFSCKHSQ